MDSLQFNILCNYCMCPTSHLLHLTIYLTIYLSTYLAECIQESPP